MQNTLILFLSLAACGVASAWPGNRDTLFKDNEVPRVKAVVIGVLLEDSDNAAQVDANGGPGSTGSVHDLQGLANGAKDDSASLQDTQLLNSILQGVDGEKNVPGEQGDSGVVRLGGLRAVGLAREGADGSLSVVRGGRDDDGRAGAPRDDWWKCKVDNCRRNCNNQGKNGICVGPVCVCWS